MDKLTTAMFTIAIPVIVLSGLYIIIHLNIWAFGDGELSIAMVLFLDGMLLGITAGKLDEIK